MTEIRLNAEQIKIFDTMGNIANLGDRKATFLPYIFVHHQSQPPDVYELIFIGKDTGAMWEEFIKLNEPNILPPHVV